MGERVETGGGSRERTEGERERVREAGGLSVVHFPPDIGGAAGDGDWRRERSLLRLGQHVTIAGRSGSPLGPPSPARPPPLSVRPR